VNSAPAQVRLEAYMRPPPIVIYNCPTSPSARATLCSAPVRRRPAVDGRSRARSSIYRSPMRASKF
jgi:hypothetical protein